MNSRIIIKNNDNTVSVVIPTPEMFDRNSQTRELLRANGIEFNNDQEVLNWIINKDVPKGLSYRVVDATELPTDRIFRNAWIDDGKQISYDMVKANNLKRDELREIRAPLLQALDVDYMRADEAKDETTKADVAAKKQALRDVTAFQDFNDVNQLKTYMPEILKG